MMDELEASLPKKPFGGLLGAETDNRTVLQISVANKDNLNNSYTVDSRYLEVEWTF